MDKQIICKINTFSLNQDINFPDGSSEKSTIEYLPKQLISYCKQKNIGTVHFFGNENYISGIIEEMKTLESTNYSTNIIKYEVN